MKNKITFTQLSIPIKIAIITAWIIGTLYIILFLIGFITALIGV